MKRVVYLILVSLLVFTSCKKSNNPIDTNDYTPPPVTYSGKVYQTVKIGSQVWMKENLDIGDMIVDNLNQTDDGRVEKYCYNNDAANCSKYGGLYQWNETMAYDTTNRLKGICPDGWHIPTKAEFLTLIENVNNNGNALKAIGVGTGSGAGTNTSGFSALLGGMWYNSRYFYGRDYNATFRNSTGYGSLNVYMDSSDININDAGKNYGFSVRCIKD